MEALMAAKPQFRVRIWQLRGPRQTTLGGLPPRMYSTVGRPQRDDRGNLKNEKQLQ